MSANPDIRESAEHELAAIESLYPAGFPDEDLLPLVRELLDDEGLTLSLVGVVDSQIVGHAICTRCGIVGDDVSVALLGPLVVAPAWQRRGIGAAIVTAGLRRLEDAAVSRVFVLGDPAYYSRLGFRPEHRVEPPFPLPAEYDGAWQSRALGEKPRPLAGQLAVPSPWRRSALWAA